MKIADTDLDPQGSNSICIVADSRLYKWSKCQSEVEKNVLCLSLRLQMQSWNFEGDMQRALTVRGRLLTEVPEPLQRMSPVGVPTPLVWVSQQEGAVPTDDDGGCAFVFGTKHQPKDKVFWEGCSYKITPLRRLMHATSFCCSPQGTAGIFHDLALGCPGIWVCPRGTLGDT